MESHALRLRGLLKVTDALLQRHEPGLYLALGLRERASERERERERLTQRRQRSAAAAQAWPLSRALGLRLRIFACPRAKSLGAGTSKPLGMLARISDGPGAARRQPVPLSHPFHINPASPSQPQTPINQTTQHRQARAYAHMRTRAPTRRSERIRTRALAHTHTHDRARAHTHTHRR